ncbi:MAG: diguanylate cyclase [Thermoanaerobaculia bacterium]|nr:diguanylate cyclase [Thermoanaerobaculia bacterium]
MSPLLSRQPIGLDEQGLSYSVLAAQSRVLQLLGDGVAGREVATEICRIAAERFAGVGCAILTLEAGVPHLTLLAAAALPEGFTAAISGLEVAVARAVFRSLETGAPDFCEAMSEEPAFFPLHAAARAAGLESCWSAPIRAVDGEESPHFSGVVCLFHPERKRPGPRGVKVLELLTSLAALAAEREARARDAMRTAASDSARERWIDPLTQLPGRQLFERMLRDLIGASDPEGARFALVLVDVDRFFEVNEQYGSRLGDILLANFARRMQKALRRGDLAARLEGDCFALLVRMGGDADEASRLAGRFREEGRRSFEFDGQAITLTVSVGVGIFPWDGTQVAMLLANAEVAMRAARAAGGDGFRIYSASLRADAARPESASAAPAPPPTGAIALPGPGAPDGAPRLDELALLWEPSFEISSRRWGGLTARLTWRRPGGGRVGAADLWRVAARAGMVPGILRWYVRNALGDFARVTRDLPSPARLTLPVAAPVLASEGFVGTIAELLAGERLAPESVAIEIPVQVLERDAAALMPRLSSLAAERVRLHLAGVGAGNLPLEALTELSWSGFKLDSFLVRSARSRPAVGALASGLLALAREMRAVSSAEQVDDPLDLTWLGLHRCDLAQGTTLRRPVEADQLAAVVAELRKSL